MRHLDPEVITEVMALLRQIDDALLCSTDEDRFYLEAEVRTLEATCTLVTLLREELLDGTP